MGEQVQDSVRKTSGERMSYEEMLALVPKVFRPYWIRLKKINGYYNSQYMVDFADGLEENLILDAGCGESTSLERHDPPLQKVVGSDPLHDCIAVNPTPKFKAVSVLEHLPFADEVFSAVYSDSVFEHINDPMAVTREFYRVLKPGGRVIINTNSVFNPFMFPNKFLSIKQREWIKEKVGIESEGTFPAPYRINTRYKMVKCLRRAGFKEIKIIRWGVPHVFRPTWFLVLQLLMELIAEVPPFRGLKHRLMATCKK